MSISSGNSNSPKIDMADSKETPTVPSNLSAVEPSMATTVSSVRIQNEFRAFPSRPSTSTSDTGVPGSFAATHDVLNWNLVLTQSNPPPGSSNQGIIHGDQIMLFSGDRPFLKVYLFNLISKQWSNKSLTGDFPSKRATYAMDISEDQILLFGGNVGDRAVSDLYELDTVTWEWSKLKPKPTTDNSTPFGRCGHSFTSVNGSFYLFGGYNQIGTRNTPQFFNDFFLLQYKGRKGWCWDRPQTNGTPPDPRLFHTATGCIESPTSSKLIIFGGIGPRRMHLGDLHIYDVESKTWIQPILPGLTPSPRRGHSATVVGSRMFVFGGWTECDGQTDATTAGVRKFRCLDEMWIHDLKNNKWDQCRNDSLTNYWPIPRAEHIAVGTTSKIYMWGGATGRNYTNGFSIRHDDILMLDLEPPTKVVPRVNLVAQVGSNGFMLDWKPVEGADSYLLQVCKVSAAEPRHNIYCPTQVYESEAVSQHGPINAPSSPLLRMQQSPLFPTPSQRPRLAQRIIPNPVCGQRIRLAGLIRPPNPSRRTALMPLRRPPTVHRSPNPVVIPLEVHPVPPNRSMSSYLEILASASVTVVNTETTPQSSSTTRDDIRKPYIK